MLDAKIVLQINSILFHWFFVISYMQFKLSFILNNIYSSFLKISWKPKYEYVPGANNTAAKYANIKYAPHNPFQTLGNSYGDS